MIGAIGPGHLWVAALIAAAVGLRARRQVARAHATGDETPSALRLAWRLPVPAGMVRHAGRAGAQAALVRAGLDGRVNPSDLARMRAAGALAGGVLTLLLAVATGFGGLFIGLIIAAIAVMAPGRWVDVQWRRRRDRLVRQLPDLLDLLGVCVESGMALDPALRTAGERLGGPLGIEVRRVIGDLALGAPRRDAYRALAERTGAAEFAQTVAALLQADELGTPLTHALRGQAQALRSARRIAARDRAAKAAPKIQLVVALVLVPAVMLLVMAVLAIELARQIGPIVGSGV
jgi:tight adherence protein C